MLVSQPKQFLELPHAGIMISLKLEEKNTAPELMIFSTMCLVVDFLHLPANSRHYHLGGDVLGL